MRELCEGYELKKLQKRYYILIIMAAIVAAVAIREFDTASFEIVKNSTAYAPENDEPAAILYEKSKVNINTADVRLLETIDGIGQVTAERIITYRTKNGKFEVIQDIMKVEGIGDKTFEEIKEDITVE